VLVGEAERGEALGLITRMEVLGHLYGRLGQLDARLGGRTRRHPPSTREISKLLRRGLAPALGDRIDTVAALSREHGVAVYLVGGLVRDLLLGRENRDVDLVVEGDGIQLARWLAEALGGRVRAHEEFLTAVVVDGEGFHIDVATARSEFYRSPAALPEVASSTLRQDLYRRDFTVNTLAIRLGPQPAPQLIDHFGGRQDLETGQLRVLHSLSFVDDPTRALRAIRLELRLGLQMSPETLHLLSVALEEGVFDRLSGSRLRDELAQLLGDLPHALRAVERLDELGLLAVLHPRLRADRGTLQRLDQARSAHAWYALEGVAEPPVSPWRLMLLALVGEEGPLEAADLEALARRLLLAGAEARLLTGFRPRLAAARQALGGAVRPHRVSRALAHLGGEELLLLMALSEEPVRRWIRRELTELRRLELGVRGRDLLAAGFAPGPAVGEALEATRDARLDGRIGPRQELEFAVAELRRRGAPLAETIEVAHGGGPRAGEEDAE
jgi:tRNA nucleotidyltransferase (CCA-adding enzyme)